MMIKEQVKALWKVCFDDSEEFVEMYFRLRYKTEVNVAIKSGDEVISALQMLPYPMTFGGETVQTSYISGACTHPDFRSKGVMRELLSQSFARMLRNGVHFSTLIPVSYTHLDVYKRQCRGRCQRDLTLHKRRATRTFGRTNRCSLQSEKPA